LGDTPPNQLSLSPSFTLIAIAQRIGNTLTDLPALDSPQAWQRLAISLLLMTIGASGMYVVVVVLPAVQSEFRIDRAQASLPYTLTMIGFGLGGILMGRLGDKFGVAIPLVGASFSMGLGFVLAGMAPNYWAFAFSQGVLIGLLGSSATFGPLMTDVTFWFNRKRGIAVAICASGNYLGGALWPPIVQHFVEGYGWRPTFIGIGIFCWVSMIPLALFLHKGTPQSMALRQVGPVNAQGAMVGTPALGLKPNTLLLLLSVAGIACCVAMAMPQVHIVSYCNDLGYGTLRGAQMLSTMLAFGIASRLISGYICDKIGGLKTLMLGSALQGLALLLFIPFDGLLSLFVISALFGLFQGGIVPSYAIIVREYFSPKLAGVNVGIVTMATLVGMALGGWMSGKVFDITGSYHAAFLNGIAWNLLNLSIAGFLLYKSRVALKSAL
jgi:MFS family permease